MATVEQLPRIFKYGDLLLADPDPLLSVKQVLDHYSGMYPEIINNDVGQPAIENDKLVYTVTNKVGSHG